MAKRFFLYLVRASHELTPEVNQSKLGVLVTAWPDGDFSDAKVHVSPRTPLYVLDAAHNTESPNVFTTSTKSGRDIISRYD